MFFRRRWRRLVLLLVLVAVGLPALWVTAKIVKKGDRRIWLPAYVKDSVAGRYTHGDRTEHMFFLLCDHWEPGRGPENEARARQWLADFRPIAASHLDSEGRHFRYSWFYPIDNFDREIMGMLAEAARDGFGEVEVHWHHGHRSSEAFESDLEAALTWYTEAGALISEPGQKPRFAFIHGNWTLDNSGDPRNCGVSDEITILQRHGCYADLTFPSLGWKSQPRTINRIYYAVDTPDPKSYDTGESARAGTEGRGLMMIHGPLALDFRNMLILFESGALDDAEGSGFSGKIRRPSGYRDYFKPHRVHLWNQIGVGVEGRRDWVFVKLHAHGMQQRKVLLEGELDAALSGVESYCQSRGIALHYVVAREAFNLVKAAERGLTGLPAEYYDLVIPAPLNTRADAPPLPDSLQVSAAAAN